MTTTILPCPFCGDLPESIADIHGQFSEVRGAYWIVECRCDVVVCAYAPTKGEAIALWNRRTPAQSPSENR